MVTPMKRRSLIVSLLTVAVLGLSAHNVCAFFFLKHKLHKYSTYICCKPYNAFTPVCFGSVTCTGCCPSFGCPQPCCPPAAAPYVTPPMGHGHCHDCMASHAPHYSAPSHPSNEQSPPPAGNGKQPGFTPPAPTPVAGMYRPGVHAANYRPAPYPMYGYNRAYRPNPYATMGYRPQPGYRPYMPPMGYQQPVGYQPMGYYPMNYSHPGYGYPYGR